MTFLNFTTKKAQSATVDDTGALRVTGAGGGGGGDASAANQLLGNASLASLDTKLVAGVTSAANSTTTNLAAAGVFTGVGVDTLNYSQIAVGIFASHASATDGLAIQQSADNVNWDSQDQYTIPATTGKIFSIIPALRYVRVVYTNGGTLTTTLRIQTNLRPYVQPGSIQRPQDARTNDNDFTEGLSYMMAYNGTTWDRVRTTASLGALLCSSAVSGGQAAHAAAIAGNPVRSGGRAATANYTAVATGQTADITTTVVGAQIVKPYSIPEADYSYAAAAGGILNTTTAVTFKAAAAAGIRNYITDIQITAEALGAATELAIRDGAAGTVLWRIKIGTGGLPNGLDIHFASPLKGTAATLLEVVTLTATTTGAVYFNAQGYSAP